MPEPMYQIESTTPESASTSPVLPSEVAHVLPRMSSDACEILKSMAHEGRLVILYLLSLREHSVTELELTLEMRQPAVSQQLARLRLDNLVSTRRDGKMVYYSLASENARAIVALLAQLYSR